MTRKPFEEQARDFAERLSNTVQAVAPDSAPFQSTVRTGAAGRCVIRQSPTEGVSLTVDGEARLRLAVTFACCLDDQMDYLAVDEAKFAVRSTASSQPLFRYEYLRKPRSTDIPSAHMHVHGHHDVLTHAMTRSGGATRRGADRVDSATVPSMPDLHFPLGGHRFRPCLEDLLEMLVNEFGVAVTDEGREALRRGREDWRRNQTRTVVRDSPVEAVDTLRGLGYTVTWNHDRAEPDGRPDRLRCL